MSFILNIDTSTETAQLSISKNGIVLESISNETQKDHAAFLQIGIQQLLKNIALPLKSVDAFAIAAGPGSYTGLRVGMASAKGLCYALNKPLISINTLEILSVAAREKINNPQKILFCPMIDARRMEVFTSIYNYELSAIMPPIAMVLQENSFLNQLEKDKIVFFGNGAIKWKAICRHSNASFATLSGLYIAMANLSYTYFLNQRFAKLAYSQPFYLKDFQDKV